jgi:hypothetical protein
MQLILVILFLVLVSGIYLQYRSQRVQVFLMNWIDDDYESLCFVIDYFGGVDKVLHSMLYSFEPLDREYWVAIAGDEPFN